MRRKLLLGARLLLMAFMSWLYGGDLLRWWRAQSSEVAALGELPSLWLSLLGTVLALCGWMLLIASVFLEKASPRRPLRGVTLGAVGLLLFDFLVLASPGAPTTEDRLLQALQSFALSAGQQASTRGVPRETTLLKSFLQELGPVPLFVRGQRVEGWEVEVREGCTGPAIDPAQSRAGTLLYCVAGDGQRAWITLVGTSLTPGFGPRGIVSLERGWVAEVYAAQPGG